MIEIIVARHMEFTAAIRDANIAIGSVGHVKFYSNNKYTFDS